MSLPCTMARDDTAAARSTSDATRAIQVRPARKLTWRVAIGHHSLSMLPRDGNDGVAVPSIVGGAPCLASPAAFILSAAK
jgi:hypothetical protein